MSYSLAVYNGRITEGITADKDWQYEHKFGWNLAVPNGSYAPVNDLGALYLPTTATAVRVKAGNAADTAAGAGARTISVTGLDETGALVTETLTTAGESASANSTTTFIRVFRASVATCGTYGGANTAAVVIEIAAGGQDWIRIPAGIGQSQFGCYTVPVGYSAYLVHISVNADAGKSADIRLLTREDILTTSAPVSSKKVKLDFNGVLGNVQVGDGYPILEVPALTDIWMEASGSGAGTEVSVDFDMILFEI